MKKGEIHSLIGENGAGKSTMMKMLYGMYGIDDGEIIIGGEKVENLSPKIAIEKGIGMVHQEFMLVDELTVLENVILGFEPRKGLTIDFDSARKNIQKYIDHYGMDVQLNKKINQISVGEAQRVEIIKTLTRGANIIILDEPTAVLTPQETQRLFEILQNLKNDGKSIVFISHKLNLWTSGEKEMSKIRGVSLEVKSGEIVGIAGIDGNGQSELIEAICGLRKVEKGSILLDGKNITNESVKKIRKAGLSHIPEDRNVRGLNRSMTIEENIVAAQISDAPFSNGIMLNNTKMLEYTNELIDKFDIRPRNPQTLTQGMSGGNAQKIVVAREVSIGGKVLIASQPTRGVDIGAIESIRTILMDVKEKGLGVLLVSADLEEIFSLSDRIIVMHEGEITGNLQVDEADEEKVGLLMMGGKRRKEKCHE